MRLSVGIEHIDDLLADLEGHWPACKDRAALHALSCNAVCDVDGVADASCAGGYLPRPKADLQVAESSHSTLKATGTQHLPHGGIPAAAMSE